MYVCMYVPFLFRFFLFRSSIEFLPIKRVLDFVFNYV